MARTRLYLVRHGEQGEGESLSARGREQAARVGERLKGVPFAAVHFSPVKRAAETAGIVGESLAQVPAHACDFVTDRTPVPSPDRSSDYPADLQPFFATVPAGERDVDGVALDEAVRHFGVTGDEDRSELLITHAFVIGWFVRHVLDAPRPRWVGLNPENCSITVVQFSSERAPSLIRFNDTGQ